MLFKINHFKDKVIQTEYEIQNKQNNYSDSEEIQLKKSVHKIPKLNPTRQQKVVQNI